MKHIIPITILLTAAIGGRAMPEETLADVFAHKIAYTTASPFYKELHTPHLKQFLPKPWEARPGEMMITAEWNIRAEGMDSAPGPFAIEELSDFFKNTAGFALSGKPSKYEIVLRAAGKATNRIEADSYTLTVEDNRIEITGPTPRGVLYGVYYLEQLLLERGIPAIAPMSLDHKPVFDVRMFGDMYGTFTVSGLRIDRPVTRDTFSALSRFGANATFNFVELSDYLGGGKYPELANPHREENIAKLARIADMANSAGIQLYLNAYNPKLPADHPTFAAHPNVQGSSQWRQGIRCLCASDPETLEYIAESWADLFRRIPSLGGMVAIVGGEGFYHCWMRRISDPPDCPRCSERPAEDVVADLVNTVFRAIREVKPDAEMLVWPYSAFVWSKEPFQLDLISKLDPDIQFVSEIDKDYHYPKDGYVKHIWDYSIDFLGPTPRYLAQMEALRNRGAKHACKTETSTAWEYTGVPFIPCMQRWGERMEIIRGLEPLSIYYAYDCTGFTRSRSEELAGRLSWSPSGNASEEIRKIAVRDFGGDAADMVIEAWDWFSRAIGHIPYLAHSYHMGPSFIGPGQPLLWDENDLPREFFGRHFYLAENDTSEGSYEAMKLRPIYTANPIVSPHHGAIAASPAQMADMDKAVALWDEGIAILRTARPLVPDYRRSEFQREMDIGAYLQTAFRAVAYNYRFCAAAVRYRELMPDPQANRDAMLSLLAELESIARTDLANARRALIIARREPALNLAVRLDLDYPNLVKLLEAKIKYSENMLREQFPAERERICK